MQNINEILARAAALRDETALNSIDPSRAGGIMYDTLMALNDLWLQQGAALVISKIYASVAAMEADDAPVSDITDQPLRAGQIVVIASSDSDNGSVYRYNGTEDDVSSWSLVGAIGNTPPVDSLDSDSTQYPLAAHQGKVLDGKISELGQYVDNPEWVKVVVDNEDKILYGVKTDGKFYFGDGCPPQVVEYVKDIIDVDEYEKMVTFLGNSIDGEPLSALLDKKLDNDGLDADALKTAGLIENPEWIDVKTDSGGNILEGTKTDGTKFLGVFPSQVKDYVDKKIDDLINSNPSFITLYDFNQLKVDKCNTNPFFIFTHDIVVNHGKIEKDFIGRDYFAKIGLFGDPHVDYTITGQVIVDPPVVDRVESAISYMNTKNVDFGFSIGDNITVENYPLRNEYREIYYNLLKKAAFPQFSIKGNHDRFFNDLTGNGVIEINNIRIICFEADFVVVPSMGDHHNSRGDVTDATMNWLRGAVIDSYEHGFITVLACHYPLAHVDTHGATFEESIRNHREDIIALCQQYNVRLYIGGHEHGPNLEYMIVSDDDITLDMTNVQLGLSYIAFSTLVIDDTGFHFISFDSCTGEQLHTLYVPFTNQAEGTLYE